jgi:hypothetical protein
MMALLKRILVEKRAVIASLGLLLAANAAIYLLVVYPLGVKSANSVNRAKTAATALNAAEQDLAAAQALVTSKTRAEQELLTFYDKVIPGSQSLARRATYTTLPDLAVKTNVKWQERRTAPEPQQQKNGRLGELHIVMVLQGDYQNVRRFIYELETAPLFVIIDDVTLTQSDAAKPPMLTLEMSTYYRLDPNGN